MDFFEVFTVDMGVDFRGGDIGMAEKFLENADIHSALQKMGGERVTERMRGGALGHTGKDNVFAENFPIRVS